MFVSVETDIIIIVSVVLIETDITELQNNVSGQSQQTPKEIELGKGSDTSMRDTRKELGTTVGENEEGAQSNISYCNH